LDAPKVGHVIVLHGFGNRSLETLDGYTKYRAAYGDVPRINLYIHTYIIRHQYVTVVLLPTEIMLALVTLCLLLVASVCASHRDDTDCRGRKPHTPPVM
jgi:hypothetical protein